MMQIHYRYKIFLTHLEYNFLLLVGKMNKLIALTHQRLIQHQRGMRESLYFSQNSRTVLELVIAVGEQLLMLLMIFERQR